MDGLWTLDEMMSIAAAISINSLVAILLHATADPTQFNSSEFEPTPHPPKLPPPSKVNLIGNLFINLFNHFFTQIGFSIMTKPRRLEPRYLY